MQFSKIAADYAPNWPKRCWVSLKYRFLDFIPQQASREKCAGCSDPILETTLKALDRSYHPQCFTCSHCPLSLDGIQVTPLLPF